MNVKVKAQVIRVTLESEYAKRPNGETDYDNKITYYDSTLQLLENAHGVSGSLTVREKLEIGSIHEISVYTESPIQVVELEGLATSRLNED